MPDRLRRGQPDQKNLDRQLRGVVEIRTHQQVQGLQQHLNAYTRIQDPLVEVAKGSEYLGQ